MFKIIKDMIKVDALYDVILEDRHGEFTFAGVVRDHSGDNTQYLEYEAYAPIAKRKWRKSVLKSEINRCRRHSYST